MYTGHISVHIYISYVLGYVLRDGAGAGIGLETIVSVCNITGHQEVVAGDWCVLEVINTFMNPTSCMTQAKLPTY